MYSLDSKTYPQWIHDAVTAARQGQTATVEFPTVTAAESGRSRAYAFTKISDQGGVRIRRSGLRLEFSPRVVTDSRIVCRIGEALPTSQKVAKVKGITPQEQELLDKLGLTPKILPIGDTLYYTITNGCPDGNYQYQTTLMGAIRAHLGDGAELTLMQLSEGVKQ